MDPTLLYLLEQNILSILKPLGKNLKNWKFDCNNTYFDAFEFPTDDKITLSPFFKKLLADKELQIIIEYFRDLQLSDLYKVRLLEYLVDLKKTQEISKIFSRLEAMDEKINQIDDKFKIIIDGLDAQRST